MSFNRSYEETTGSSAPLALTESYCECALLSFKETGSEATARNICSEELTNNALGSPSQEVAALYPGDVRGKASDHTSGKRLETGFLGAFGLLGSISAVALGIASFVGGLLGWLLVMRKRILQCDVCGAIVNAS